MNHEVEVSNLMFNKTSNEQTDFKKYDINVDLEEESSNEEKTILKFSLDLTSNPKNSVINISGNTILSGEQEEIEDFLKQENEKTPEVVSIIYQELFPLMYIITKNMKIPAPSHTISQNQITNSDIQNEPMINDEPSTAEKPKESEETTEKEESIEDVSEKNSQDKEIKEVSSNKENEL
jgi:methanogenic corrinoid protein MtbC1